MADLPRMDPPPRGIEELHWFSPEWPRFLVVAREQLAVQGFVQMAGGRLTETSIIHRGDVSKTLKEWLDAPA